MPNSNPIYDLFAIKYATRDARRPDHFLMGDPHDVPMPLDYFVWAAVGPTETVVIDTGFTAETAERLKRTHLRCPAESLSMIGVDPGNVKTVIQSHLHYDHVGNFHKFPSATFHLQEKEMLFTTGRHMRHKFLNHGFNLDDILGMVRLNYDGRVRMYNGEAEVAPGITIHPIGGHTPGMQFVCVNTKRGRVVLASDGSHFYDNMETGHPFPAVIDVPATVEGYETIYAAAPTKAHVVPGHDPKVLELYPAPEKDLDGIVVRLDVDPVSDS